jgi:hypothetical protein
MECRHDLEVLLWAIQETNVSSCSLHGLFDADSAGY